MQHQRRDTFSALAIGLAVLLGTLQAAWALQVGDKAPLFELPASTGETVKLADYLGKQPVVLFFYVGAFTKT